MIRLSIPAVPIQLPIRSSSELPYIERGFSIFGFFEEEVMRGSVGLSLFLALATATAPAQLAFAASEPSESSGKRTSARHAHHAALALGTIVQTEGGTGETERIGLEYEYIWTNPQSAFTERWGVGGMIEFDRPPIDSLFIAAQFAYHPVPQARLVVAPAYNLGRGDEGKDSWALRVGMVWEFEVGERFSIAPEIFFDVLEAGDRAAVLAVALGYGF